MTIMIRFDYYLIRTYGHGSEYFADDLQTIDAPYLFSAVLRDNSAILDEPNSGNLI